MLPPSQYHPQSHNWRKARTFLSSLALSPPSAGKAHHPHAVALPGEGNRRSQRANELYKIVYVSVGVCLLAECSFASSQYAMTFDGGMKHCGLLNGFN